MIAATDQPATRLCCACFDGSYPIELPGETQLEQERRRAHAGHGRPDGRAHPGAGRQATSGPGRQRQRLGAASALGWPRVSEPPTSPAARAREASVCTGRPACQNTGPIIRADKAGCAARSGCRFALRDDPHLQPALAGSPVLGAQAKDVARFVFLDLPALRDAVLDGLPQVGVGLALLCRDRVSTNTTSPAQSGSLGSCAAVPVCHADSTSPLGMRASASDTDFR